jgi:hypothetical protein
MGSLIQREKQELLPMDLPAAALESLEAVESRGEFTGERLASQDPDRYRACVELLGRLAPVSMIAKVLRISPNTVRGVRAREGESIDDLKKRTVAHLTKFVGIAAERFAEEADSIDIDKLAVPMGIATEKLLLLTGQATSRVEHTDRAPAPIDFASYLQSLPDVTPPEMGYEGETLAQRASLDLGELAGAGGDLASSGDLEQGAETREADIESAGLPGAMAMATAQATNSAQIPGAGSDAETSTETPGAQAGGGGGHAIDGGGRDGNT